MSRILLLLDHKENRWLLTEVLTVYHQVLMTDPVARAPRDMPLLNERFDLCILDGPALDRFGERVQARKEADQPLFLPFLLITSRRNVGMATRHLWRSIDELIISPIEKVELQARVEILLRARQLSLELKRRNEDLEAFIHAMTHDLRAPLLSIQGYNQAFCESQAAQLDEQGRHYQERIGASTKQMWELIDALLGFSRLGRKEIRSQTVYLNTLLQDCLRDLQEEIRLRDAQIIVQGELPAIQSDPILLKVALTNLLSNALRFVAPGARPLITLSASVVQGVCRIQVEDNGVGIGLEDQQRIFQPFVRLHDADEYPGTGLGLSTVRKVVELMGGRVGVRSFPAGGSVFWLELNMEEGREMAHPGEISV